MPWKGGVMSLHLHPELATLGAVVDRTLVAERAALDGAADAIAASLVTAWPEIPMAAVWSIAREQLTEAALSVHLAVTKYPYPYPEA